jgi:hypothetical protein
MVCFGYISVNTLHNGDDDDDDDDDDIMECRNKRDTSKNRGNHNYLKIIQKILESTKSKNYRKQPYWPLHIYCGKYRHLQKQVLSFFLKEISVCIRPVAPVANLAIVSR